MLTYTKYWEYYLEHAELIRRLNSLSQRGFIGAYLEAIQQHNLEIWKTNITLSSSGKPFTGSIIEKDKGSPECQKASIELKS